MMEDVLLHRVFLNSDGLAIVTSILETALTEKNYSDYPDAVIPIISILKNLCFHQPAIRDDLSNDVEIFYWILRGLFMFFTEEQLKQDAASLLFVLIFKDFVQGNLSRGDFSIPAVINEKIRTPFQCGSHWKNSSNTKTSLKGICFVVLCTRTVIVTAVPQRLNILKSLLAIICGNEQLYQHRFRISFF